MSRFLPSGGRNLHQECSLRQHDLANGFAGQERTLRLTPAAHPKNILVIGGGPAGCEFALCAAKRGHLVTLWEREQHLGGQLFAAAAPPGKHEFLMLVAYYETVLKKAGVKVCTNRSATCESVVSGNFDEVITATGSCPRALAFPASDDSVPVVYAVEVLSGSVIPGRNVVIVGGGAVGCETAQYLARQGAISAEQLMFLMIHHAEPSEMIDRLLNRSARNIAIVELTPKLGTGFDCGCAWPVMKDLERMQVMHFVSTRVVELTGTSVIVEPAVTGAGSRMELPCDTLFLAAGSISDNRLGNELLSLGCRVHFIGDAQRVGRIPDAINKAIELALKV